MDISLKHIALMFFFTLSGIAGHSVPAFTGKVKILTDEGDTVYITLHGDENIKYATSEDGHILLPRENTWYYARTNEEGMLIASEYKLTTIEKQANEIKSFTHDSTSVKNWRNKVRQAEFRARRSHKVVGERHTLVILMQFADQKLIKRADEYEDLFNKIGYDAEGAIGSVRDYYRYVSYEQLDCISDVYGPYTAANNMAFYGGNGGANGSDMNPLNLTIEALQALPKDIDLSQYDNDGDGMVDNVHIIFAGHGEEAGASPSAIWSHEYPHKLPVTISGYGFAGYSCTPELRSNIGSGISRIGVICHELGHAFGANDYYDVDYETNGSYEGTGCWDLMASGSWNDNGKSPANFNPYVKTVDFGWCSPETVTVTGQKSLQPYNATANVIRLETGYDDDYYLLENRQLISFDASLPAAGMLIYHVHPQIESTRESNSINISHPQRLYVVCASSQYDVYASQNYGNINSAGCPFTGSTNRSFSAQSTPRAFAWNGKDAIFSITGIDQTHDGNITFYVATNGDSGKEDPLPISLYKESFENGIDFFDIGNDMGSTSWNTYPRGFVTDPQNIPVPKDGNYLLTLYNGLKSVSLSESYITSPTISLAPDSSYNLSLWYCTTEQTGSSTMNLKCSVKGDNGTWETIETLSEYTTEWVKLTFTIPSGNRHVKYRLNGTIENCGIFIDDISMTCNKTPSTGIITGSPSSHYVINVNEYGITVSADSSDTIEIYSISGKKVVPDIRITNVKTYIPLRKGLYIARSQKCGHTKFMIR